MLEHKIKNQVTDTKTSYILKIQCRPLYLDILPIIISYLKHLSWKIINKFLMLQITSEIQIINHFQYFSACFLPKGSSSPIMPVLPDAWLEHSENLTMNKKSSSGQNCQAYEEDWILQMVLQTHWDFLCQNFVLIRSLRGKQFLFNSDFRCYVIFNIILLLATIISETPHAILHGTIEWLFMPSYIVRKSCLSTFSDRKIKWTGIVRHSKGQSQYLWEDKYDILYRD